MAASYGAGSAPLGLTCWNIWFWSLLRWPVHPPAIGFHKIRLGGLPSIIGGILTGSVPPVANTGDAG